MNGDTYEDMVTESATDTNVESDQKDRNIHLLSFKDPDGCSLYDAIRFSKKTVEGRKNAPQYQKIKVGDMVLLSDRTKGILECEVTYIHEYADTTEYLAGEGLEAAFGELTKCRNIQNISDGTALYREFVDDASILDLKERFGNGFLGIGIKFVHEFKKYFDTLNEPWFSAIRDKKKIAEGRLDKSWVKGLQKMDMIEFTRVTPDGDTPPEILPKIEVLVTDIKRYKKFTDLFDDVGLEKVLPGKKSYNEGIAVYRKWYSEEKERELGVVGIFVDVIKK